MSIDRKNYENIEIPIEVSGILEKAVSRKRRMRVRMSAGIAMVFAVILVSSNTPAVYAALSNVPVIGNAVKIFHIGSGGLILDGLKMDASATDQYLKLMFSQNAEAGAQAEAAPSYKIEEFAAPDRIIITVNGIRGFDVETFMQEAEKCSYIKTAYREMLLDDSAARVALELQPNIDFEVTEYKEPASLELRLFASQKKEREVWFIRSRKMEMSEELALMPELLPDSGGVIAGTQDGSYIFCIGEYETQDEAVQALEAMDESIRSGYSFWVDHCRSSERPK